MWIPINILGILFAFFHPPFAVGLKGDTSALARLPNTPAITRER